MKPYRGLTKDGKWVYGYHLAVGPENNVSHYILPHKEAVWTSKVFSLDKDKDFITGFVEVIPETVGQQVGLKDKNKEEIYAGDKLRSGKRILTVVWDKENLQWRIKEEGCHFLIPLCQWAISDRFEIIHTTPELMKK